MIWAYTIQVSGNLHNPLGNARKSDRFGAIFPA